MLFRICHSNYMLTESKHTHTCQVMWRKPSENIARNANWEANRIWAAWPLHNEAPIWSACDFCHIQILNFENYDLQRNRHHWNGVWCFWDSKIAPEVRTWTLWNASNLEIVSSNHFWVISILRLKFFVASHGTITITGLWSDLSESKILFFEN